MPIVCPDGQAFARGDQHVLTALQQNAALVARNAAFRASGICTSPSDHCVPPAASTPVLGPAADLLVLQREGCTVYPGQFRTVASEDATTCHIVFLRGRGEGAPLACGHLDSAEDIRAQMTVLTDELVRLPVPAPAAVTLPCGQSLASPASPASPAARSSDLSSSLSSLALTLDFDMYIVGGYLDENNTTIEITSALIAFCLASPVKFHLQLFFAGAFGCCCCWFRRGARSHLFFRVRRAVQHHSPSASGLGPIRHHAPLDTWRHHAHPDWAGPRV